MRVFTNIAKSILWLALLGNLPFECEAQDRFKKLENELRACNSDTACLRLSIALCDSIIFNDPEPAKVYAKNSLQLATALADTAAMAKSNNQLGVIATIQGLYLTGLEHYQAALQFYRAAGDEIGTAKALNNIGVIYTNMSNFEEAANNYREALKVNSSLNDHNGISLNLYNLSIISAELDNFKEAEVYADSLRSYQQLHGRFISDAPLYAEIFLEKGILDSAEFYLRKSIQEHKKALDESMVANDYIGLARLDLKKNNPDDALYHLNVSGNICKMAGFNDTYLQVLEVKAEALAALGRYNEAFEVQRAYTALDDSLTKVNNFHRISELNARYESEKRDRQIAQQEGMLKSQQAEEKFRQRIFFVVILSIFIVLTIVTVALVRNRKTNRLLQVQNNEIKLQRQKILSSINYARKIQNSILVPESVIRSTLPESFVYFQPKDIVSGDFYWYAEHDGKTMLATIDCTGHGVPGAFMSLIAYAKLNKIVNEQGNRNPGIILSKVHDEIMESLNQQQQGSSAQDGMDMSFCVIDHLNNEIQFAGARNPIVLLRNGELEEIKADALSIGGHYFTDIQATSGGFKTQTVRFSPGDYLYMFTDGYMDQFGGNNGRKMNKSKFRDLLTEAGKLTPEAAKEFFNAALNEWKLNHPQLDDILVIGVKL